MSKKVNNRVNNKVNNNVENKKENTEPKRVSRFSPRSHSGFLYSTKHTMEQFGLHQDFQDRMLAQGYTEPRVTTLNNALLASTASTKAHFTARQLKMSKTKRLTADFKKANAQYSSYTGRIRKVYRGDTEFLQLLGLNHKRETNYAGFIDQAETFYSVASSEETARVNLEAIGITTQMLQDSQAEIAAFDALWSECEKLKGDCQRLIEIRDQDMKVLRSLMGAFILACRHEFKETPQALETLGIFTRNSKPKQKTGDTEPIDTDPINPIDPVDPNAGDPGAQEPAAEQKTA